MDFYGFMRECYLRSEPSVDLDMVTAEKPVNCSDHKLKLSEYERILEEIGVKDNIDEQTACNMWMLQYGPSLIS